MAAIILMLGSAMAALVAGQVSVKKVEPEPQPEKKTTNSSFWAEEVERAREPEPGSAPAPAASAPAPAPAVSAPAPAPAAPTPVPIDCQGDWSEWSACTKPCEGGTQFMSFTRTQAPEHGGMACPNPLKKTRECNTQACPPIDCKGDWSEWSACTKPCEGGTQFMSFTQTQAPEHGGVACPNPLKKTRECNTQACPPPPLTDENAEFKGYRPVMTNRKCNNHGKALTNEYLRGDGEEKVASNDVLSWKYQRLLERGIEKCDKDQFCQYVELQHGKSIGRTFKQADCRGMDDTHPEEGVKIWEKKNWVDPYMQDPAHGYEQTGTRNLTCSGNTSGWLKQGYLPKRDGKAPSFTSGGFKNIDTLYGEYLKQGAQICNSDDECKYVSVFLDGVYRTYNADACETKPMSGMTDVKTWKKVDPGVAGKAVVDCEGTWSNWTECSKPCNGGTQERTFTKTRAPERGGKACPNPTQTQACNTQKCPPVHCEGVWSEWGSCSKVCGGGTQSMTLNQTVAPENGGRPCPPTRTRPCNTQACPPPEPPMWKCGGDPNAKILFSQLNDNNCDCQPGFDDEPKTGKCDVPKKVAKLNDPSKIWAAKNDRGVYFLRGKPSLLRKDKSGWEYKDHDFINNTGTNSEFGWGNARYDKVADACAKKINSNSPGFSVWRFKRSYPDPEKWKCREYTKNNGSATDEQCVNAPWLRKSCMETSPGGVKSDEDNKLNQYAGNGLYWRRTYDSTYGIDDEWISKKPKAIPKSTNNFCASRADPSPGYCKNDNKCCGDTGWCAPHWNGENQCSKGHANRKYDGKNVKSSGAFPHLGNDYK